MKGSEKFYLAVLINIGLASAVYVHYRWGISEFMIEKNEITSTLDGIVYMIFIVFSFFAVGFAGGAVGHILYRVLSALKQTLKRFNKLLDDHL